MTNEPVPNRQVDKAIAKSVWSKGNRAPGPEANERERQIFEQLDELYQRHLPLSEGEVSTYYDTFQGYLDPKDVDPLVRDRFALSVSTTEGEAFELGECAVPFALQSLSKVFVYGLALADRGRAHVLRHVGVEPSGEAFTSLEFDEHNKRPFNPMVNAGALATTSMVFGRSAEEKMDRILGVLRGCSGNDTLAVDEEVFTAEWQRTDRNRAIAYLMRSQGMIAGDVEEVLALYLRQCSVRVTCHDVANMASTLANGGVNPVTGRRVFAAPIVRDLLTIMYTCGMYDFAGEWAFSVGIPAKSGVSGGVLAVAPGKGGIGIFSAGLDRYGNSVRGTRVCQELSQRLGLHLFANPEEDQLLGSTTLDSED